MQEVDQKMSITSDMVKSNVLEMRRHKESVSTQLNGSVLLPFLLLPCCETNWL